MKKKAFLPTNLFFGGRKHSPLKLLDLPLPPTAFSSGPLGQDWVTGQCFLSKGDCVGIWKLQL